MAREVVRLLISLESQSIPIRRDEIRKRVPSAAGKGFHEIFERAKQILRDVFGFDVLECVRTPHQSLQSARKGVMSKPVTIYILTNALTQYRDITQRTHMDSARDHHISILIAVTIVKLSTCSESRLQGILERLGLGPDLTRLYKAG